MNIAVIGANGGARRIVVKAVLALVGADAVISALGA